jgi:hypothetical protein
MKRRTLYLAGSYANVICVAAGIGAAAFFAFCALGQVVEGVCSCWASEREA